MKLNRKSSLTNRTSKACMALLIAGALTVSVQQAQAAAETWNNLGTDYNTLANWTSRVPKAGDVGEFTAAAAAQPNLSASVSNSGIYFMGAATSGYDITATNGAVFTLTGYGSTGNNGTSDGSAAAVRSEATSGSNTIDAPITIAPGGTGHTTSVFYQAAGGGTLILNGAISAASGIDASFKGGGTIQLNGANTFDTASIDQANTTVGVGNDGALGTGTFTFNNSSSIQATGGARTVSTNLVAAADATISGSNAFTFNGNITGSGATTRTITVNNTAATTFAGNVFLQNATSSGSNLVISGSGAVNISGVVQDGGTGPGTLKYNGTGTLTLSNANTYTGGTSISNGNVIANHDGAFGTGDVSLVAGTISLTLQNGVTQQYISSNASLSIVAGQTINLNFNGTNVIGSLIVDGTAVMPGVYGLNGMVNPDGDFFGLGTLTVAAIPEPSVYMLLGVGLLLCGQRFFRRRRSA